MIPNFIKHRVCTGDSLNSISSRLNISEKDLQKFHNQNCGTMNKLFVANLKGIDFVLIPTRCIFKEQSKHEERLLPSSTYFSTFHLKKYWVEESLEKSKNENLKFSYNIDLSIKEKKENFIAEIHFKNLMKNDEVPEDKTSSLALECMKSLYPISYQISLDGRVESFFGHQNLIEKFKTERHDIKDFFVGKVSQKYLDMVEKNLSNEDRFFCQMQSTLLYQILFPNIELFRKKSIWKEKFHILSNCFPLEFSFQTQNIFEDSDLVETKITGTLSENCSLKELLKGIRIKGEEKKSNINVEIQIQYFTNTITKQLHEVKSSVNVWYQNELYLNHQLQITQN